MNPQQQQRQTSTGMPQGGRPELSDDELLNLWDLRDKPGFDQAVDTLTDSEASRLALMVDPSRREAFRTGQAVADRPAEPFSPGQFIGTAAKSLWNNLVPSRESLGALGTIAGEVISSPLNPGPATRSMLDGIRGESVDQFQKSQSAMEVAADPEQKPWERAKAAMRAVGHAGGTIPLIGPAAVSAGEALGSIDQPERVAEGIGEAGALLLPEVGSMAAKAGFARRAARLDNANVDGVFATPGQRGTAPGFIEAMSRKLILSSKKFDEADRLSDIQFAQKANQIVDDIHPKARHMSDEMIGREVRGAVGDAVKERERVFGQAYKDIDDMGRQLEANYGGVGSGDLTAARAEAVKLRDEIAKGRAGLGEGGGLAGDAKRLEDELTAFIDNPQQALTFEELQATRSLLADAVRSLPTEVLGTRARGIRKSLLGAVDEAMEASANRLDPSGKLLNTVRRTNKRYRLFKENANRPFYKRLASRVADGGLQPSEFVTMMAESRPPVEDLRFLRKELFKNLDSARAQEVWSMVEARDLFERFQRRVGRFEDVGPVTSLVPGNVEDVPLSTRLMKPQNVVDAFDTKSADRARLQVLHGPNARAKIEGFRKVGVILDAVRSAEAQLVAGGINAGALHAVLISPLAAVGFAGGGVATALGAAAVPLVAARIYANAATKPGGLRALNGFSKAIDSGNMKRALFWSNRLAETADRIMREDPDLIQDAMRNAQQDPVVQ